MVLLTASSTAPMSTDNVHTASHLARTVHTVQNPCLEKNGLYIYIDKDGQLRLHLSLLSDRSDIPQPASPPIALSDDDEGGWDYAAVVLCQDGSRWRYEWILVLDGSCGCEDDCDGSECDCGGTQESGRCLCLNDPDPDLIEGYEFIISKETGPLDLSLFTEDDY